MPRYLHLQSSVAITHYTRAAPHHSYLEGIESESEYCKLEIGFEPRTHQWACAGAANDLINRASPDRQSLQPWTPDPRLPDRPRLLFVRSFTSLLRQLSQPFDLRGAISTIFTSPHAKYLCTWQRSPRVEPWCNASSVERVAPMSIRADITCWRTRCSSRESLEQLIFVRHNKHLPREKWLGT